MPSDATHLPATLPTPDTGSAGPVRVVLVDDHAMMREGIRTILQASGAIDVVGTAANGQEALAVVREQAPDVVCMDVEMPVLDGLEATRRLVADPGVTSRVLVLTTFEREDYLITALEAGASGFLLKNSRPEQLVDAIVAVAAGEALLAPELTMAVIKRAVRAGGTAATTGAAAMTVGAGAPTAGADTGGLGTPAGAGGVVVPLTDRELEVLELLALGLSNEEIAARLFVGRATVKTHVSNVLAKLGLRDRVQAVAYAYRSGLVPLT
ncbi:LuxR family two component transcriptional regulator [Salana multivorans]|uniref:LuxR family two component transcriptional regulator n=1 Tax=Salana multivorans TaxID=120377 RepID=A0A3N2DCE9_9MICO|nr:response regulator transcription factor [Salana multivorans]ROR97433.1 LuxR family two component transcriptional regulator [Salana multivorans]